MSFFTCLGRYLSHTRIVLFNKQTLERIHDLFRCSGKIVYAPLRCDRWIASSLLQKSIRRGEVELAQRAACTLHAFDRSAIWRRLVVIACEDIGVGDIHALAAAYRSLGAGDELAHSMVLAAKRAPEVLVVLAPLTWLEVRRGGPAGLRCDPVPQSRQVAGIPLYAFDKHTRIGKRAIER